MSRLVSMYRCTRCGESFPVEMTVVLHRGKTIVAELRNVDFVAPPLDCPICGSAMERADDPRLSGVVA